jgi:hypothetical protein
MSGHTEGDCRRAMSRRPDGHGLSLRPLDERRHGGSKLPQGRTVRRQRADLTVAIHGAACLVEGGHRFCLFVCLCALRRSSIEVHRHGESGRDSFLFWTRQITSAEIAARVLSELGAPI